MFVFSVLVPFLRKPLIFACHTHLSPGLCWMGNQTRVLIGLALLGAFFVYHSTTTTAAGPEVVYVTKPGAPGVFATTNSAPGGQQLPVQQPPTGTSLRAGMGEADAAVLRAQIDALKQSVGALTGAVTRVAEQAKAAAAAPAAAPVAAPPPTVVAAAPAPAAPAAPAGEAASWLSTCKVCALATMSFATMFCVHAKFSPTRRWIGSRLCVMVWGTGGVCGLLATGENARHSARTLPPHAAPPPPLRPPHLSLTLMIQRNLFLCPWCRPTGAVAWRSL